MCDNNGLKNAQNKRIWTINHGEAIGKGGVKQNQKFPQKVMVWLSVFGRILPLVILDKRNSQPRCLYEISFASSSKIRQPSI